MKVIWDGPKYARRAIFWAWVFAIICAVAAGFIVGTARAAELPQTSDPLWVFYGLHAVRVLRSGLAGLTQ
jgi:uncharacterized PurR-regulated membrane protein YhhQ (DUF165 family)